MTRFLILMAAASAVAMAVGDAEGKTRRKPPQRAPAIAAETDYHANAYDPSGNYRGYPDWARRALSPRQTGGGR